ncbi:MAG: hypothetical protein K2X03_19935 [Bryobacteraceae bacterium]|nr:hypothetical protein [Bryobacteraceae bacterium]
MLPAKLETLRRQLLTGERFGETWEFFLNDLASDEGFMRAGRELSSGSAAGQKLIGLLAKASSSPVEGVEAMLVEMPQFRFIHGSCKFSPTQVGGLLWFEDLACGMAAIMSVNSPQVTYARITTTNPGRPS